MNLSTAAPTGRRAGEQCKTPSHQRDNRFLIKNFLATNHVEQVTFSKCQTFWHLECLYGEYLINLAGTYYCHVNNTVGEDTCHLEITGNYHINCTYQISTSIMSIIPYIFVKTNCSLRNDDDRWNIHDGPVHHPHCGSLRHCHLRPCPCVLLLPTQACRASAR